MFSLVVDDYLSARFVSRLLIAISITAILAAGESIVIITRNIDLSIGAIVGVAAYLTSECLADHRGLPAVVAVAIAVAIGAVLGLVNGVLVAVAEGAVDHRHPRHDVDLPQPARRPRRRQDDRHRRPPAVARRHAAQHRVHDR